MGEASKVYPFEYFAEWVFGYRPNSEYVDSLKKNNPTCENSKYLSFSIYEEILDKFVDQMWRLWKKFWHKGDGTSLDTPLKEEETIHEVGN